ncbi:hypothetical protein ACFFK0_06905 [Paenibacillus chartarius]|uniref:Uncharacterized protein n=1 Tax=Paenibacillus chartarius TaxID=747481 RepID=A0ABV6DHQ7_9BACL
MNWEERFDSWTGRFIEIHIVDLAGHDPVAPPRVEMLHSVKLAEQGAALLFYINLNQFVCIPLHNDSYLEGKRFESGDSASQLIYHVQLV